MSPDIVEQLLRDHAALCWRDADPELAAVRAAILLEDVLRVAFGDAEIDPAVLGDPASLAAVLARLSGPA